MRKTLPMTGIPDDFALTENTLERLKRDCPTIDIKKTLDKFILNAEAKGWMYRNWQAAFINYIDNGEKYGGVFYLVGKTVDPRWAKVLEEASKFGFRQPLAHETPEGYRTQFQMWHSAPKTQRDMSVVANLFKA